jgi:hypothetical protein
METPLEPDPFTIMVAKINSKSDQLKSSGMTDDDRKILDKRLSMVWGEPPSGAKTKLSIWRWNRARQTYERIQDRSAYLFLAVILAISPTDCVTTVFKRVWEYLISLPSYRYYLLEINPAEKRFFESVAAEHGFMNANRYVNFMNDMFPQSKSNNLIIVEICLTCE